jgi:hypothetical protein
VLIQQLHALVVCHRRLLQGSTNRPGQLPQSVSCHNAGRLAGGGGAQGAGLYQIQSLVGS